MSSVDMDDESERFEVQVTFDGSVSAAKRAETNGLLKGLLVRAVAAVVLATLAVL